VILLTAGVVAISVGIPPLQEIRGWAGGAGWAGPVLFAGLYAVLTLTLTPTPATVLNIGAGLLFGLPGGLAVVMAGAMVSAVTGFGL